MLRGLVFNSKVSHGNGLLCGAELKNGVLEVAVTPEPKNGPESLWLRFRLEFKEPFRACKKLRLMVKHLDNALGALPVEKIRLVARSLGGAWRRLAGGSAIALPDGRTDATWELDIDSKTMDFAFCFPYGMDEVERLVESSKGYFKKDVIGISPEGRELVRLSNGYQKPGSKKPGIFLVARQHSGETSGSWALHGFLERFAERKVRDIALWCVPLANIDGVENGCYGKDNFPIDMNRAWGVPPMRYENNIYQKDIELWSKRVEMSLALDFHSPGGAEDEGVYCFLPKTDEGKAERSSSIWAGRFKKGIPDRHASEKFKKLGGYHSRWNGPCAWYTSYMNKVCGVPALSFEFPYSQVREESLEIDDYRAIGRSMADAVLKSLR